jgi:hypothetical protein
MAEFHCTECRTTDGHQTHSEVATLIAASELYYTEKTHASSLDERSSLHVDIEMFISFFKPTKITSINDLTSVVSV